MRRYGVAEHLKDRFGAAQLGQSTSDQARGGSKRVVSDQSGRAGGWSQVGHSVFRAWSVPRRRRGADCRSG